MSFQDLSNLFFSQTPEDVSQPEGSFSEDPSPFDLILPDSEPQFSTISENSSIRTISFFEQESMNTFLENPKVAKIEASKKISKKNKSNLNFPTSCATTDSESNSPKKQYNKWSQHDDSKLMALIAVHGYAWSEIAIHFPNRNGKQVRDHFFNLKCPGVKNGDWTQAEDECILNLVGSLGTKWKLISQNLPGRTENQVKNRYYGNLRKKLFCSSGENDSSSNSNVFTFKSELSHSNSYSFATSESNDSLDYFMDESVVEQF